MFNNPEQNIAQLGLREGMKVADLGSGTGAYSIAAGIKVGHTGHVYAVEVQKNLVKKLESEIKESGILNVGCVWGDIEKKGGTKIADNSMDAVIISNVLFLSEDKIGLLDEAKRILKKDGKVLFIDWLSNSDGSSPNIGLSSNKAISPETATDLFAKRGFKFLEKITTSDHHYGIIFIHE